MHLSLRKKSLVWIIGCAVVGGVGTIGPRMAAAADAPAQPATRPVQTGPMADYHAAQREFYNIIPRADLADPAKREQAAAQAIPVLQRKLDILDSMPGALQQTESIRRSDVALLYLFKDPATVQIVNGLLASKDPDQQLEGQLTVCYANYFAAGTDDPQKLNKAIDEFETVAKAHPDARGCSEVAISFGALQKGHPVEQQMQEFIMNNLTSRMALGMKKQHEAAKKTAESVLEKQHALLDKPLALAGKTLDGKDFTTADLKGKVVMVDFWATWCKPCVASLPHVKEVYKKYHEQGLEIVGIDKDEQAKQAIDFIATGDMPWAQIFDTSRPGDVNAAAPSNVCGVTSIPFVMIIDKKGIVRSVTAREDMDAMIPKLLAE